MNIDLVDTPTPCTALNGRDGLLDAARILPEQAADTGTISADASGTEEDSQDKGDKA